MHQSRKKKKSPGNCRGNSGRQHQQKSSCNEFALFRLRENTPKQLLQSADQMSHQTDGMIEPVGISHNQIQDKSQDYCKQRQFHNVVPSTGVSL